MNQESLTKTKRHILIAIFLILIITITILFSTKCIVENTTTPITRDATINDITIDNSNEFALSVNYTMIPKVNIENLELTFYYKDSQGKTLTTKKKDVGNVKKGIQYKIEINLAEFGINEIFKISYAEISVTNGKVPLI